MVTEHTDIWKNIRVGTRLVILFLREKTILSGGVSNSEI